MAERGITRRSLLSAAAGALAGTAVRPGGLLGPAGALGAHGPSAPAGVSAPRVFDRAVGTLTGLGDAATVRLGGNADLLGVRWLGSSAADVELRFRDGNGPWSRWVSAAVQGHGPEAPPASGSAIGEPVWSAGATEVQVRSRQALAHVSLTCVDVSGGLGARRQALAPAAAGPRAGAAALALVGPALPAAAGQPPIIARRAWAHGVCRPRIAPAYGSVQMAFVHHTENPNGYTRAEVPAMLRAIYAFHTHGNGWNDIGYNFVIDRFGRIFEARAGGFDEAVIGAHAGGYNYVSTGIAVLGEFMSVPISKAAKGALQRLLAWKLSLHGTPVKGRVPVVVDPAGAVYSRFPANAHVSLPRVAGHRDADTTDCPGNVLYGELPAIRTRVATLAGRPARLTLALAPAPAPSASAPPAPSSAPVPTAPPAPAAPPAPSPASQPAPATTSTPEPAPAGAQQSTPDAAPPGQSLATGEGAAEEQNAPQAPTSGSQQLAGTLSYLDGAPVVGAPVLLQERRVSNRGEVVSERTVAQTTSGPLGQWSLALALSPGRYTWLRALSPGANGVPAAVSEPVQVAGAL